MPGVLQVHIGDQHANAANKDLDWLDGSVMTVWDEFRALLAAAEWLMASLQNPDRGAAFDYPQFRTLRSEWFAIRRNVNKLGGIGQNTLSPTSAQMNDLFTSWTNRTSGNAPEQQITRAKYNTYDPAQWGRETDKQRFLYIVMDRDLTNAEVNSWGGKYTAADTDPVAPEHNPKWIHYPDDLVTPGHITERSKATDTPAAGTKDDVRDPGRIIDVATGRPDTILRDRIRQGGGSVILPSRIDDIPWNMSDPGRRQ